MQVKRVWTLIALAGLAAVTVMRSDRDLDKGDGDRARSQSVHNSTEKDPLVSGDPATSAVRHGVGSAWLLFRTDWSAVLWRVYQKMNENRLLAVAAGVVFYGPLAIFPAITAFVSLYGLLADPSTIHERLSFATGVLPQGALNILSEQLTRLTSTQNLRAQCRIHWRPSCCSLERKRGRQSHHGRSQCRLWRNGEAQFCSPQPCRTRFHARVDLRAYARSGRSGDRSDCTSVSMVLTPDNSLVDRAAERKRIERDRRVGAERLANLLHVRRIPAEIGDGKERAVTGAHADGVSPAERAPFRADRTAAPRASFAAAPRFSAALRPPARRAR